jgi:hypothetical protein
MPRGQGLVGIDEELVEREAGRADVGDEGRQAVDVIGDLVDARFHDGLLRAGAGC